MSNYPDDCQSNSANLPWNEPEQEVECTDCGCIIDSDDDNGCLCDECYFYNL